MIEIACMLGTPAGESRDRSGFEAPRAAQIEILIVNWRILEVWVGGCGWISLRREWFATAQAMIEFRRYLVQASSLALGDRCAWRGRRLTFGAHNGWVPKERSDKC